MCRLYQFFVYNSTSVAVAWSSPDDSATRYVLAVLWLMSYLHIMERMGQNHTTCMFRSVRQVAAAGAKYVVSNCILLPLVPASII